jgi:hypothetical protein
MSRKKSQAEPSTFRLMYININGSGDHLDFKSKDDAIQYAESISNKIEWYGIYELNPKCDYLIMVTHKRILPYINTIYNKDIKTHRKKNTHD